MTCVDIKWVYLFRHTCLYAAKGRLPLPLAGIVSDQRFILPGVELCLSPNKTSAQSPISLLQRLQTWFLQQARRIQTSTRPACLGTQQLYCTEQTPLYHVENAATFLRAHACVLRDVCEAAPQGVKCLSDALIAAERREAF